MRSTAVLLSVAMLLHTAIGGSHEAAPAPAPAGAPSPAGVMGAPAPMDMDAPAPAPEGGAPTPPPGGGPTPAPTPPSAGGDTPEAGAPAPAPVPAAPAPTVAVSMTLTVADPQAFVDDPNSQVAMENAIATTASVDPSAVTATLTVARRLAEQRKLQGSVNVAATIEVADAAAANSLSSTMAAVSPEDFAATATTALTDAGVDTAAIGTLSVSAISAEAVIPAPAPSPPSGGSSSDDDFALKGGLSWLCMIVAAGSLF